MGIGALDTEGTKPISVEVTALDRLVIAVGHAVVPFAERLSWHGVVRSAQLMRPVRKRTLVAEVATASGLE